MGRGFKKLYLAGAGAAFLVVLLLILAFILPRVVDSQWLKEAIRTEVAKQVKADFDFQKAELSILPHPAVSLQQVNFSIPDTVKINFETLTVYPKLLPLLTGNLAISKVVVEEPDFSLPLPEKPEHKTDQGNGFAFSAALDSTSAKLTPILTAIPGLKIGVRKGTLRLFAEDKQVFLFENLNGEFDVSSKNLTINVSCKSNIWESMELQAAFVPSAREGKGVISLDSLNGKVLTDYFLEEKPVLLGESFSSLEADFTVSPETGFTADIKSSGSSFAVLHKDKKISAKVENLRGRFQYSDQISAVTIDDLTLSSPGVQLSGSFNLDRTVPHASLDIKSQSLDITSVREVLPLFISALYGDLPVVQDIFDIVRGGNITQAVFHVEGKSPADLAVFESMRIQGHIENADISLADLGLDLQEVTGDAAIARGILEGRNLQARHGNSTGSDGTLKLGLSQTESTRFHLDLDLNADLSEVPPLLKKLVPKKQVIKYLSLIETLTGTGQGRMTLGESLESLSARIDMNKISVQVKYKPIPYPLSLDGGRILYDGLKTESFNLQGKVGRSTFADYSSHMSFEGEPTIEVKSGTFQLVMDEIFPWLAADKRLEDDLKDILSLTGIAEITVKNISGPLLQPSHLQYDLLCGVKDVTLEAAGLPGPLKITRGQMEIIPDKNVFENLQGSLLDSSFTFSGVLQNYLNGRTNAEIIVTNAEIGPEVNAWFSDRTKLPQEYIFRTPLLISRSNVKWTREELLDLQGDFSIAKGPIFSVDIMLVPDELLLRNLSLKNNDDRVRITLDLKKRAIGAEFHGNLSKKSVDAILLHNDAFPDAWITGDIKFYFDMDSPAKSVASGKLEGGDFIFPWKLDKPLLLDSFAFTAADKTITLNAVQGVFEGKNYSINGQATLTDERLSMDFDVRTDTVELDKILGAIKDEDEQEKAKKGKGIGTDLHLALVAAINLHADSLLYNGYTWKPFEALITYKNSLLDIEVSEAELCHLSTPGKVSFHEGKINLNFQMETADQELREVLVCLEGGEKQMTGTLNLKANISGQGTRDTLVNSLGGSLQYSSKDGYIYQDAHLAKLLYVLNVTNLFQGKIPDLANTGFHYDSLVVKGTMERGILTITPARLDAPILEISAYGTIDIPKERVDLQVLVAPLQTINKLQKLLPVISKIIPESLVAVPVEVNGDFSDIRVRTLSVSAISKNVFGTMVDALSTPVRVLEEKPEEEK